MSDRLPTSILEIFPSEVVVRLCEMERLCGLSRLSSWRSLERWLRHGNVQGELRVASRSILSATVLSHQQRPAGVQYYRLQPDAGHASRHHREALHESQTANDPPVSDHPDRGDVVMFKRERDNYWSLMELRELWRRGTL